LENGFKKLNFIDVLSITCQAGNIYHPLIDKQSIYGSFKPKFTLLTRIL